MIEKFNHFHAWATSQKSERPKKVAFFQNQRGPDMCSKYICFEWRMIEFCPFFKQKNDAVTWSPWILNSDKKKEEFFLSEKFAQCNNLEENEVNSFFTHKWLFGHLPNFGILKNVTNVKVFQKSESLKLSCNCQHWKPFARAFPFFVRVLQTHLKNKIELRSFDYFTPVFLLVLI